MNSYVSEIARILNTASMLFEFYLSIEKGKFSSKYSLNILTDAATVQWNEAHADRMQDVLVGLLLLAERHTSEISDMLNQLAKEA